MFMIAKDDIEAFICVGGSGARAARLPQRPGGAAAGPACAPDENGSPSRRASMGFTRRCCSGERS
jgi:hypothetical protein